MKKRFYYKAIMSMQQEAETHTLLQELQRKEEGILENENNLKKIKEETSQLRKRTAGVKSGKVRASKSMQSSFTSEKETPVVVEKGVLTGINGISNKNIVVVKEDVTPSIFKGTMYFPASHNSKKLKSSSGSDHFFSTYPVRKGNASSIGKKEVQKRATFIYDVHGLL